MRRQTQYLLVMVIGLFSASAQAMNYTAIFNAPPRGVPTRKMPDGPLLGNGDVGIAIGGPAEAQSFYIGKNDFWTHFRGKPTTWVQSKVITVGRVDLNIPALAGATYRQEQDLAKAEVRGTFTKAGLTVRTRSWMQANKNLLLTELQCEGAPVKVSLQAVSGDGGVSTEGWFTRKADKDFADGRKVAVVSRVIGKDGMQFTLKPGESITVATAILSDLDASAFLPAARTLVAELTPETVAELETQHRAWWTTFWERSFIEIEDKVIEKHWYGALYVMASCSRAGKVAPGLWGNWVTTDSPRWQGDFHLNYNFEAPFYILYASNHPDVSLPFYQAITEAIPGGRAMAKRHGWKGVHFPVGLGPWGLFGYSQEGDHGQRSNAAYVALNFIWYWQYTQDEEWLKTTGYPYLREVAAFWEDYLKLENGRYVIHNDAIIEKSGDNMNPILSLGLVHNLFKNIIPMSKVLGLDTDKCAIWQDILDKLSAFPLMERGGKTVFRLSEKGLAWNDRNTLGVQHIFPSGAIGLDSDPKLLEISHNTINAMNRWADYNGFSSWYTACARVGYNPKVLLDKLRAECDKHALPNLLLYYGGGGIESCGGFLAINEMLLQSHEGVIRLFPNWSRDCGNARYGNLRAVGAFLVSAELKNGVVTGVTIVSEKGGDCTVENPWPGKPVTLIGRETQTGERFTFKTTPGETIELRPAT